MRNNVATVEFQAHLFLIESEDVVCELEVWVHEMHPTKDGTRTGAEWARDHLVDLDKDWWLQESKLQCVGDFQLLVRGKITGFWDSTCDGDDYDEECELTELKYEALPDGWYRRIYQGDERCPSVDA